ncbi:MAG: nitrous oxide-stimulated promoter family protein [Chloroflexi bacterium]|nr:nitrous oxide-stimulated promoter family protein [Chloroflexota bacterium]
MIGIYCRELHGTGEGLCVECQQLQDYAMARLAHCPFQESKPTCAKCLVHCYKTEMRDRIKVVMRYAGPPMLREHPGLAVRHLIDGWRKPPPKLRH